MKLWEIKANALKLMFADSDVQFSKEEFENGSLESNGNTRDKLVRMNDSIRRAIDLYYQHCGQFNRVAKVYLEEDIDGNMTNILNLENIQDFGLPNKININFSFRGVVKKVENIPFHFDNISKTIMIDINLIGGFYKYESSVFDFDLFYRMTKENLPNDIEIDDLVFDLNILNIPEDIQRIIPKYIKGELYEEDEASIAKMSKDEYIQFLYNYNRKFSTFQTKVKSTFKRG